MFRLFGDERVCLISDSMRAAGMPNGVYSLGGQTVYMTDGKATLEDGTIAGSATCLAECFRRAVSFGVPLDAALRAATINPAQAVGLFDELGSITAGKRADVLVLDETLHPEKIFIGGVQTKYAGCPAQAAVPYGAAASLRFGGAPHADTPVCGKSPRAFPLREIRGLCRCFERY